MDETDVIKRLGQPDEIVIRSARMRRHAWKCSACGKLTISDQPIPVPAPCTLCGGIAFEATRVELH